MEITGVGTASMAGHTLSQSASEQSELHSISRNSDVERPEHHDHHERRGRGRGRGHGHGHGHRDHHGLSALRQEIRLSLSTRFHFSFSSSTAAYSDNASEQLPRDVAAEALGVANEIAARSPLQAGDLLVDVRRRIDDAAQDVRESLGDEAQEAVDGAIDLVNRGLDGLEEDAARNIESSASVLSAETQTRQRSTIRIRTQEGDEIRLSLRNVERMSVEDVSISDGNSNFSSSNIQISSRSRMVLRVEGDLNEAEMTAIRNVFEQAEAIADEFFGGDLAAAFDLAAGLEYDSEQLSRINMRFRERQITNVAYAVIGTPVIDTPAPGTVEEPAPVIAGSTDPVAVAQPESAPEAVTPEAIPDVIREVTSEPSAPMDDAINGFFDLLAGFLDSLNDGFEPDSRSNSFRFFHSQSFNLQILKTVFQLSAPEDSGNAADAAATLIDSVSQ